jgi:hypothetical protein
MMMEYWQLQEARNHFSELVEKALRNGPQSKSLAIKVIMIGDWGL